MVLTKLESQRCLLSQTREEIYIYTQLGVIIKSPLCNTETTKPAKFCILINKQYFKQLVIHTGAYSMCSNKIICLTVGFVIAPRVFDDAKLKVIPNSSKS